MSQPPVKMVVQDLLRVEIYEGRRAMGLSAANRIAEKMKELLARQPEIRMVFAAAPSQEETLAALIAEPGLEWNRVTAFHMDEYLGLPHDAPQRFSRFLEERLFGRVPFKAVHLISGNVSQPDVECQRYAGLLREAPIDIVCLGIGENGHIAFNDPPVADFADPRTVKVVQLDEACRQQQVNDGCFPELAAVPRFALTLTVPALMSGRYLYCVVPGERKRQALERMLRGPIEAACPASVLRRHPACVLFTDLDAEPNR